MDFVRPALFPTEDCEIVLLKASYRRYGVYPYCTPCWHRQLFRNIVCPVCVAYACGWALNLAYGLQSSRVPQLPLSFFASASLGGSGTRHSRMTQSQPPVGHFGQKGLWSRSKKREAALRQRKPQRYSIVRSKNHHDLGIKTRAKFASPRTMAANCFLLFFSPNYVGD